MPFGLGTNSPELLLKFLPLTYHHSHFLAATLDFTSFFTIALLGAAFFLQLGYFGLDITSFCICKPQSQLMAGFGAFLIYLFFFTTGRRKRFNHNCNQDLKQIFNILTIFDFIRQITYIYHMLIFSYRITCLQLIPLLGDLKCS